MTQAQSPPKKVSIRCPHCDNTFEYPVPSDLPMDGTVVKKSTTCPICDKEITIPFQAKARSTTVYRGEPKDDQVLSLPNEILAEKGE